jgi:hypothetical protein
LLWGAGLVFILPPAVGELMLGSIWPSASALIVPTTLAAALGSLFDGALVGLRALGVSRRSMAVRIARATASVVGGIIGAFLGSAAGSVWGATAGTFLGVLMAWWQLRVASPARLARLEDNENAAEDQLT